MQFFAQKIVPFQHSLRESREMGARGWVLARRPISEENDIKYSENVVWQRGDKGKISDGYRSCSPNLCPLYTAVQ